MKKALIVILVIIGLGFMTPFLPAGVGQAIYAQATDLEASLYGFEQKQVQIDKMTLHLYDNGAADKPVLVLLHGYSADKDVWPRFAKEFTDDYRVLIPDMAGHGDTAFQADWDYSAPAQAKRLNQLLSALDIDQIHVAGNSMGGSIAAHFALMYPEKTTTAILFNPSGAKSPQPSTMQKMLAEGDNPFQVTSFEDFKSFFQMTMAQPPWLPDVVLKGIAQHYQSHQEELAVIFEDLHGTASLEDKLNQISVPVLLMWGDQDQLIHVSSVSVWKAGVPNIQTKVWEGIGHMPMMEIPKQSAELVQEFLAKRN